MIVCCSGFVGGVTCASWSSRGWCLGSGQHSLRHASMHLGQFLMTAGSTLHYYLLKHSLRLFTCRVSCCCLQTHVFAIATISGHCHGCSREATCADHLCSLAHQDGAGSPSCHHCHTWSNLNHVSNLYRFATNLKSLVGHFHRVSHRISCHCSWLRS